jgi:hypothetical protein
MGSFSVLNHEKQNCVPGDNTPKMRMRMTGVSCSQIALHSGFRNFSKLPLQVPFQRLLLQVSIITLGL